MIVHVLKESFKFSSKALIYAFPPILGHLMISQTDKIIISGTQRSQKGWNRILLFYMNMFYDSLNNNIITWISGEFESSHIQRCRDNFSIII